MMLQKLTACLTLCLFFSIAQAQNWAAFRSNETFHFRSDTATVLPDMSVHFDSVSLQGADSVFHVARLLQDGGLQLRNQPMFCGRQVVAKSNGDYLFRDPIHVILPTRAAVGTTFVLDSLSGQTATLTRAYAGMVLGSTMDSIKVYATQSGDSIRLSKAHGLLAWPASLGGGAFSLSGLQHAHLGDTLPGFEGFWNLAIGDYYYSSFLIVKQIWPQICTYAARLSVDAITPTASGYEVICSGIYLSECTQHNVPDLISSHTFADTFLLENGPLGLSAKSNRQEVEGNGIFEAFDFPIGFATYRMSDLANPSPQSYYRDNWSFVQYFRHGDSTELRVGLDSVWGSPMFYASAGDTCQVNYQFTLGATLKERLGLTYVTFDEPAYNGKFRLVGTVIGGDTVGQIYSNGYLTALSDPASRTVSWTASPNPADDVLEIEWTVPRSGTMTLCTVAGQVVAQQAVNGQNLRLDVHALPAGLYLLTITQGGRSATKRVAVMH